MITSLRACLIAVTLGLANTGVAAELQISLGLPVDCPMGTLCTIQKYVDHDPGPERMDYACGRLSLDGDTGTDFRVPDLPAMHRGVPVTAAADGVVKSVRDGMPDVSVRTTGQAALQGRWAGNGVVLDHGDGWETQYSHLRQGSVRVQVDQRVTRGQVLGLIGMSGNAEFPHVEFVVRRQGRPVDPFVGPAAGGFRCGDPRTPLWDAATETQLAYRPTVLLSAGFATGRPEAEAARAGDYAAARLSREAPALVFWVDVSGTLAGDRQEFRILAPDGRTLHQTASTLARSNISWFAYAGQPRPADGWAPGRHLGQYRLIRNGTPAIETETAVEIVP